MEEKGKKSFISWVKEHKKQLIIAGVSITAIIIAILAVKNRGELLRLWTELKEAVAGIAKNAEKIPVEVAVNPIKEEVVEAVEVINTPKLVVVDSSSIEKIPFDVTKHVRNLAPGYHPSAEKIATALEYGFQLRPNQTWVKDYTKGLTAAA